MKLERLLWIEPVGGCAGDMTLAALFDLGVPVEDVEAGLRSLGLDGWSLEVRKASKCGIVGTRVDVRLEGKGGGAPKAPAHHPHHGGEHHHHHHGDEHHHHSQGHGHQDHAHAHPHDHPHDESAHHAGGHHDHAHPGSGPHHHGDEGHPHDHHHHEHSRTWAQIRALITAAPLPPGAIEKAIAVFERIARAEAHVHGTTPDEVHFHEVGAVDSIVDIVGVALALDWLGVRRILAAPPPLGSGIARSQHGPIPIPAPATLEILKGREVRSSGPGERTTPTGAAILAALSEPGPPPAFLPERIGYGVGHADFPDAANLVRMTLGRPAAAKEPTGEATPLVVLECNLDDASPQVLARALEACLEAGALDAWIAPLTMKKGRPGHLLGALAPAASVEALSTVIFRETPTLGIRHHPVDRRVLERRFQGVQTRYGEISIKIAIADGEIMNAAPEWEDCLAAGRRHGVPARRVREEAMASWASEVREVRTPKT